MNFAEWFYSQERLIIEGKFEDQALALIPKAFAVWEPEQFIDAMKRIAPEPKYLPAMSFFANDGWADGNDESYGSVWRTYKNLVDSKKLPMLQITNRIATWGTPPTAVNWLNFSEKIHALEGQRTYQQTRKRTEAEVTNAKPIFSANNIDVYEANNAKSCVQLGKGYSFCISRSGNSMWQSYRDLQGSSFYFVFDRSRADNDPLHVVVVDMSERGPQLTDASNHTGTIAEFGKDTDAYFKHLETKGVPTKIFQSKPRTPEEHQEKRLIGGKIRSLENFKLLTHDLKSKYIGRGHGLDSYQFDYLWQHNLDDLIKQYISTGIVLTGDQLKRVLSKNEYRKTYLRARMISQEHEANLNLTDTEFHALEPKDKETHKQMIKDSIKTKTVPGVYAIKVHGEYAIGKLSTAELIQYIDNNIPGMAGDDDDDDDYYTFVDQLAQSNKASPDLLAHIAKIAIKLKGIALFCTTYNNYHTPQESINQMANAISSRHEYEQKYIAKHRRTPLAILKRLAKNPDTIVRAAVAENGSISWSILQQLAQDKDDRVRRSANNTLKYLESNPRLKQEYQERDPVPIQILPKKPNRDEPS